MKLLHLASHMHHVLFEQEAMIGGFYNWNQVFPSPNNFLTYTDADCGRMIMDGDYDVLLFGISRPEMVSDAITRVKRLSKLSGIPEKEVEKPQVMEGIISQSVINASNFIREKKKKNKDVKIVGHVDYAVQLWASPMLREFFTPYPLMRTLESVDYIFSAEPVMGEWIHAMTGRDVYFIPHPTNTIALKQILDKIIDRSGTTNIKENVIRIIIHRYDNNWIAPFIVAETGYNKFAPDAPMNIYVTMDGTTQFITELRSMGCEYVEQGTPHTQWLEKLARTRIVLDSYHGISTYGRSPVECACLKTPAIGSKATYLQDVLFPDITSEINGLMKQKSDLKKLLENQNFYDDVTGKAYEEVDQQVSYDVCADKFEAMINGKLAPRWHK